MVTKRKLIGHRFPPKELIKDNLLSHQKKISKFNLTDFIAARKVRVKWKTLEKP